MKKRITLKKGRVTSGVRPVSGAAQKPSGRVILTRKDNDSRRP